jgi:hypothetical protein
MTEAQPFNPWASVFLISYTSLAIRRPSLT